MYPHHVFDLEPAGTFRMYPICYWQVSGGYLQPEPVMYSRCFHWFLGPLAPSVHHVVRLKKKVNQLMPIMDLQFNWLLTEHPPSNGKDWSRWYWSIDNKCRLSSSLAPGHRCGGLGFQIIIDKCVKTLLPEIGRASCRERVFALV